MNNYKIAAYIRLSKEDEKNKESESVANQRNLIKEYLNHHNLNLKEEYIDDGYTGTNFDRPAFNKLIQDIENKQINMVITKDLSRLGRNYIKSGYYIEEYFPSKKVRYISILDNVDTIKNDANNDIAPFKSLFNDMVSKDTSKKIKSILKTKKKEGKYLASKAPYGYKKNPKDKHKLIINKKEAQIVKEIYIKFLKGKSINQIVNYLNKNKVASPSKKKWTYISAYNILKNKTYLGITTQNVWTNISYKNKTKIKKEKEEWIINKNAHTPIIDKDIFNKVQNKLKKKTSKPSKREKLLLEGLIYCHDCHHRLGVNKNKNNYFLVCNNYKKNTKSCTSHYTNYQKLENEIIKKIKHQLKNYKINIHSKNKIKELNNKLNILYKDRLNNIISLKEYQTLKKEINEKIDSIKKESKINISKELIFNLINQITIDKNKNIYIEYKFKKPSIVP